MMLVTEEQAKEMWCPAARCAAPADSQGAGTAGNRYGYSTIDGAYCIGSRCMWWRWFTYESGGNIFKPTGPNTAQNTNAHIGYCGMAGRP